jgi:hypothetical protein
MPVSLRRKQVGVRRSNNLYLLSQLPTVLLVVVRVPEVPCVIGEGGWLRDQADGKLLMRHALQYLNGT